MKENKSVFKVQCLDKGYIEVVINGKYLKNNRSIVAIINLDQLPLTKLC